MRSAKYRRDWLDACVSCWGRVDYSLAFWRFKPIWSSGLRFHSRFPGGLGLKNYRAVAGNHKFSSRFSVFACFCGGYSNRVKKQHTQPLYFYNSL